MKEYKYITVPSDVVVGKGVKIEDAVASALGVIKAESIEGWELVGVAPVTLYGKKKYLKSGSKVNTFIFAKDKD